MNKTERPIQLKYNCGKYRLTFYTPTKQDIWSMYDVLYVDEYRQILDNIKPTDIVLDAGAHVGFFAITASLKARLVVAVEPLPRNFRYLVNNIKLNHRTNIIAVDHALSNYVGISYLSGTSDYGHLSSEGERVQVITIDALLTKLGVKDLQVVKMDIEGAEADVLSGLFLKNVNSVALEVHGKKNEEAVKNILESSGFSVKVWQYSMVHTLSKVAKDFDSIFLAECKTNFASKHALKQWIATRCFQLHTVDPASYRRILLGSKGRFN